MNPIITLTTDFGSQDGYVAAMKGRILGALPQTVLVDVSHDIPPHDIAFGARTLARATASYPAGSIHVAVVDPGVGSDRAALLVHARKQWFLGPDNGLLSLSWGEAPDAVYRLHPETRWWTAHHCFDGLALFAPAAVCVAEGIETEQLGLRTIQYEKLREPLPQPMNGGMVGEVVGFDRFGNALTNISQEHLALFDGVPFMISCGKQQFGLTTHYAGRDEAQAIAIINSDQRLELACYQGSAREIFGLRRGELVMLQKFKQG